MHKKELLQILKNRQSFVTADAYSTAWVALVPHIENYNQPQWPQALAYIRQHQLLDGGWGAANVYNAHERTICTLAVLRALLEWRIPGDDRLIERGLQVLHTYAGDMHKEPHEPVGFELLLPSLAQTLAQHEVLLPQQQWAHILKIGEQKLQLIGALEIDYESPRSWWFNMEMLPEDRLAQVDDRILNVHGSICTSTGATAAYLRALRLQGKDSPRAAAFLARTLAIGQGGAGFCWPIEHFELLWALDLLKVAEISPQTSAIQPHIQQVARAWRTPSLGFAWSAACPVSDGDDTSVAYDVLRWAGQQPCETPFLAFWDSNHFCTYLDERTASVTANLHALSALLHDVETNDAYARMAHQVTEWLRPQLSEAGGFTDKWHFSPMYVAGPAIAILREWDPQLARQCLDFVLRQQHEDGGWGIREHSSLEETGHAVIGLVAAFRSGLLVDKRPLQQAAHYLRCHLHHQYQETLWMGKTLYQPPGITKAVVQTATYVLAKQNFLPGL